MRLSHLLQAATLAAFFPSSGSCIPTWEPWQAPCPSLPADILASFKMTNSTRTFIEGLFSAVALDNFGASFASALSDDLTWTVTGSSPIAGTYHPKTAYISQVLTPLRAVLESLPVPIVEHIVVDEDWVNVVWRSEGVRGKNGANYDMKYSWLMRVRSEAGKPKIIEVFGFYDGQKVANVFQGYNLTALREGKQ